MPKKTICHPTKGAHLVGVAQECFKLIRGGADVNFSGRNNVLYDYHSPEEIEYIFEMLFSMVSGYVVDSNIFGGTVKVITREGMHDE